MKKLQIIGAFCAVISISSHAELHLRQGGFVYDDVLDITWMQPSGFVAPNVTGPFRSANDAFGTIEWAKNLSIFDPSRNRTWDDWRLPSFSRSASDGVGNLGGQRAFTFVDCSNATEVACRDNEMGYMFHQNGISVSAPGPFVGLQAGKMWSSTEGTPTIKVYFFDYGTGQGGSSDQNRAGMGWAVRDGDVGVGVATDGARILNLSTKSFVGVNDQRQVAGIVIRGSGTIRVGIKAEAPSLQGVANLLGDPKLTLKNALTGEVVAVNDNWVDGNVDLLIASNTVPNNLLEAAMVVDLPAGSWTALVEGVGGTTGIALVSVKEIAEESSTATLLNLSTKSFVGVNDERQVVGMVIVGKGTVRVLIKSVAPSLQNVQGLLDDPQLILKNALTGEVIKVNDNWQDDDTADEICATGSAPPDSREAAMVVDLPAGSWTALVEGVDNSTGVALVSVTKLDFDAAPTPSLREMERNNHPNEVSLCLNNL